MNHPLSERSPFVLVLLPLLAALTAGCSRSEIDTFDLAPTRGGAPFGDITGTRTTTYVTEQGDTVVPMDLTGGPVEALYQNADASWVLQTGAGKADGSFVISGVPGVPFLLRVGYDRYFTAAREITFNSYVAGRPDRALPTKHTEIVAEMDGVAPWGAKDGFEWYSANADGFASGFEGFAPQPGDTALTGQKSSWDQSGLPDASKGDTVYATQLARHTGADGTLYSTIERFARLDDVTLVDGEATTVTGTLGAATNHESVAVDFHAAELVSAGAAVHPGATLESGPFFLVDTSPGVATHGPAGFSARLLVLHNSVAAKEPSIGTVSFDNPFPASWGTFVYTSIDMSVSYEAPGTTQTLFLDGGISMIADLATMSAGPIRPVLTPVLDPRVNGQSAFEPLTGVTTQPILSWSPPAVGTPSMYIVVIYDVEDLDAGGKAFFYHDGFFTSETTVPLVPGALKDGNAHVFSITALMDPSRDPAHPHGASVNQAMATTLTSLVVP